MCAVAALAAGCDIGGIGAGAGAAASAAGCGLQEAFSGLGDSIARVLGAREPTVITADASSYEAAVACADGCPAQRVMRGARLGFAIDVAQGELDAGPTEPVDPKRVRFEAASPGGLEIERFTVQDVGCDDAVLASAELSFPQLGRQTLVVQLGTGLRLRFTFEVEEVANVDVLVSPEAAQWPGDAGEASPGAATALEGTYGSAEIVAKSADGALLETGGQWRLWSDDQQVVSVVPSIAGGGSSVRLSFGNAGTAYVYAKVGSVTGMTAVRVVAK